MAAARRPPSTPRPTGPSRASQTDPLGAVTTSAYDLAGNKTKETDRLGRVSTFVFDAADRLVEERWQASASAAVSHTIKRLYDGADQLRGVTETDTTSPAATTAWQFAYDALGQLIKSRIVKNGNSIVPTALVEYDFTYDKAGNLLTTTEDQAAVAQFGALGPAASGLGVRTSYIVDALNRVTRSEQGVPGGAVTKRTDYAYRPDGSVGSVTRFAGAGVNP